MDHPLHEGVGPLTNPERRDEPGEGVMASRTWSYIFALSLVGCAGQAGSGGVFEGDGQALANHDETDVNGTAATASPTKLDLSSNNPFFFVFGTNGRTCGTCHDPTAGWTLTPSVIAARPTSDPLFLLDGSDCLPPGAANPDPNSYSTALRSRGLIRVEIGIPANADYVLTAYSDPFHCDANPLQTHVLREYRRPLPSANSGLLATIMWDGREPTLQSQANDATLGHAQAAQPLTTDQQNQIAGFESNTFHAQTALTQGKTTLKLTSGVNGGPDYLLSTVMPAFFVGINDTFSPSFNPVVFDLYAKWESSAPSALAASVGRGEKIFNTRPFQITGVAGLNGPNDASQAPITGTCSTCHNNPDVGNHSVSLALDIGVTAPNAPGLDVAALPTYTFRQRSTGKTITVTDAGRGLITGRFADLGKTKGPTLRGLSARAPYFHNGGAPDLAAVVDFYDQRFGMGLSAQDRTDLINFLAAL